MTTSATVVDLIEAFRRSKTMFVAVALGVFDATPATAADMRGRLNCSEIERLLDACVALGLLERRADVYQNTAESDRYLRGDSPDTLAGYVKYSNNILYPMWAHLEDAVREGSHRWKQTFGLDGPIFSHFYSTEDAMREFLEGMHGFGQLSSPRVAAAFDLSPFRRMVDLGGASGHLAAAARERYPKLEAVVFDLPSVARLYPETVPGDFFADPLPEADLYAVGRILHDWSEPKIRTLLNRVYSALPPGGGLLVAEKLLENVPAHMQSLNMLVVTEGRERTEQEYDALLRTAGFASVQFQRTGAPLDAILAIK
jgi:acetylserotonin N-methyltransferase